MQFRCTQCQGLLQIDQRPPHGLVRCPHCQTAIRIPEIPVAAPSLDLGSLPLPPVRQAPSNRQQYTLYTPAYLNPEVQPAPPTAPHSTGGFSNYQPAARPARRRQTGGNPWAALGIIGGIGAFLLLLCCGGMILIPSMTGFTGFNATATAGGYSVKASGSATGTQATLGATGQTIRNRITGSEFVIAEFKAPEGRATPDGYLTNLRQQRVVHGEERITRAGLDGIHYECIGVEDIMPAHSAEVFQLSNSVLVVMYMNGEVIANHANRQPKMEAAKARALDKPDEFFASLAPAE